MKCPKCQKEMYYKSFVMKYNYIDSDHKWICECGHVYYTPKIRTVVDCQTITASHKIEIESIEVSFTCQICGDSQTINGEKVTFPVCDKCKAALKELVEQKRLPK